MDLPIDIDHVGETLGWGQLLHYEQKLDFKWVFRYFGIDG